jgi:hypothetical protein
VLIDTPSLEGCEAKFGRAKAHAKKLREEITAVLDGDAYKLRVERDEDTLQYIFYVQELPSVGGNWGLAFGDAIHNFRATLDHLVVQLAILGQGRALSEKEVHDTAFPVISDPSRWDKVGGPNAVRLLRSGDRERIRDLQPFNASDRSIWGRAASFGGGARIPRLIEALHHADIADKHRFVHPSWYTVGKLDLPDLPGLSMGSADGERLKHDSEAGRWSFEGSLPDVPSDLNAESYFPLDVAFEERFYGYSMLGFLDELERTVGALIELFRPPLASSDPAPPVTSLL